MKTTGKTYTSTKARSAKAVRQSKRVSLTDKQARELMDEVIRENLGTLKALSKL